MKDMYTPCVTVESATGAREVPLSVVQRSCGNIFISGEIDQQLSENFLLQILYYEQNRYENVNIFINSPGGNVRAGLMILDVLKNTGLTVNLICCGIAYSMAAVILAAGQKGRRYIFEHGQVMIHEPLLSNGVSGSASSIRQISDSIMNTRETLNGILAKHTGKTIEEINKATSFDNFMSPEEAIEFGLCDEIMTSKITL